jgi:hypothetical protein
MKLDNRYTITLENVGFSSPRHVARFCGDYLGQNRVKSNAMEIAVSHNKNRF